MGLNNLEYFFPSYDGNYIYLFSTYLRKTFKFNPVLNTFDKVNLLDNLEDETVATLSIEDRVYVLTKKHLIILHNNEIYNVDIRCLEINADLILGVRHTEIILINANKQLCGFNVETITLRILDDSFSTFDEDFEYMSPSSFFDGSNFYFALFNPIKPISTIFGFLSKYNKVTFIDLRVKVGLAIGYGLQGKIYAVTPYGGGPHLVTTRSYLPGANTDSSIYISPKLYVLPYMGGGGAVELPLPVEVNPVIGAYNHYWNSLIHCSNNHLYVVPIAYSNSSIIVTDDTFNFVNTMLDINLATDEVTSIDLTSATAGASSNKQQFLWGTYLMTRQNDIYLFDGFSGKKFWKLSNLGVCVSPIASFLSDRRTSLINKKALRLTLPIY